MQGVNHVPQRYFPPTHSGAESWVSPARLWEDQKDSGSVSLLVSGGGLGAAAWCRGNKRKSPTAGSACRKPCVEPRPFISRRGNLPRRDALQTCRAGSRQRSQCGLMSKPMSVSVSLPGQRFFANVIEDFVQNPGLSWRALNPTTVSLQERGEENLRRGQAEAEDWVSDPKDMRVGGA